MTFLDNLLAFDIDKMDIHAIDNDQRKAAFRLLKSDKLEFFTHITPQAVLAVWTPVILITLYFAVRGWHTTDSPLIFAALVVFGFLVLWTFMEYILHRFLFHMEARGHTMTQIVFLFHGIHHYQPHVKTRLVMPPLVSIPMGLMFYGVFSLLGSLLSTPTFVLPTFAGTLIGYVTYDMVHYATHHSAADGRIMRFLKRHHMEHHYKTPNARFGVTNDFWDRVFHTEPTN